MRQYVRRIVVVALGVGLMAFFLRNADLGRVAEAIGSARRDLLVISLLLTVVTYGVRVVRWRYLLRPVGHVGIAVAFRATVMGFAVTALLPGRVGEVLRPYVLARRARLSVSAVFATVVVERLFDLMAVLLLFGASVVVFDPAFATADETLPAALHVGALIAGGGALVMFAVACLAAGHPERVGRGAARLTTPLPDRVSTIASGLAHRFVEGLAVMRQPLSLLWVAAWSVVLWLSLGAVLWLATTAFGIDMPAAGAGVLLALVVVGVTVPTPAGIGGYHAAYQVGVVGLYAASADAAVAAGLVVHAISFLPVTLIGIVFMAQEGLWLSRIGKMVEGGVDAVDEASELAVRDDGAPGVATIVAAEVEERGRLG